MDLRELRKATAQSTQALAGMPVPPMTSGSRADKGVRVATIDNYQGRQQLLFWSVTAMFFMMFLMFAAVL